MILMHHQEHGEWYKAHSKGAALGCFCLYLHFLRDEEVPQLDVPV
jgi:hypothetical protein